MSKTNKSQDHAALVEFWQEVERMGGPERYIRSELKRMNLFHSFSIPF